MEVAKPVEEKKEEKKEFKEMKVKISNGKYDIPVRKASTNEKSKALLLEKADHTFHIFTDDKSTIEGLIQTTKDWFVETLK